MKQAYRAVLSLIPTKHGATCRSAADMLCFGWRITLDTAERHAMISGSR